MVGTKEGSSIRAKKGDIALLLRAANWMIAPIHGARYDAQIRYHGALIGCTIDSKEHTALLAYADTIPLGQSVVFYEGDTVVGGAIIDSVS